MAVGSSLAMVNDTILPTPPPHETIHNLSVPILSILSWLRASSSTHQRQLWWIICRAQNPWTCHPSAPRLREEVSHSQNTVNQYLHRRYRTDYILNLRNSHPTLTGDFETHLCSTPMRNNYPQRRSISCKDQNDTNDETIPQQKRSPIV